MGMTLTEWHTGECTCVSVFTEHSGFLGQCGIFTWDAIQQDCRYRLAPKDGFSEVH
jgi:hypothetical protein